MRRKLRKTRVAAAAAVGLAAVLVGAGAAPAGAHGRPKAPVVSPPLAEGLAGPLQIAVVGSGADADALRTAAWRATSPGTVVVAGQPDAEGVPLLADRPLVGGEPAAYVCRGFVCDRPTTDPVLLADQLSCASR